MTNIAADINVYRQMVAEAKQARDEQGIVSDVADSLVGLSDVELYARITGKTAPSYASVEASRPAGVFGQGTASRYSRPAPAPKANRYGARCITCNAWVEAEAGLLAKNAAGKWAAEHKAGECVQAAPVVEAPVVVAAPATAPSTKLTLTEGFYELAGVAYKVQQNLSGSGLYGKKLVDGSWTYVPGVVGVLTRGGAVKLTAELASKLGELYGRCVICGRKLTAEESIERSIGRICFEKNF